VRQEQVRESEKERKEERSREKRRKEKVLVQLVVGVFWEESLLKIDSDEPKL